jgi:hypothetical protein
MSNLVNSVKSEQDAHAYFRQDLSSASQSSKTTEEAVNRGFDAGKKSHSTNLNADSGPKKGED